MFIYLFIYFLNLLCTGYIHGILLRMIRNEDTPSQLRCNRLKINMDRTSTLEIRTCCGDEDNWSNSKNSRAAGCCYAGKSDYAEILQILLLFHYISELHNGQIQI